MKKQQTICNKCGKKILAKGEVPMHDVFFAKKEWGYFSNKDGENHSFVLCEACYDALISTFKIPVKKVKRKEYL